MKRIIGILTVCFCLFIINGQVVSASINNVNLFMVKDNNGASVSYNGILFAIYDKTGREVYKGKTDNEGKISVNIPVGSYTLKQLDGDDNVERLSDYDFVVTEGDMVYRVFGFKAGKGETPSLDGGSKVDTSVSDVPSDSGNNASVSEVNTPNNSDNSINSGNSENTDNGSDRANVKGEIVKDFVPAYEGNYTRGRYGHRIKYITIHHMAGRLSSYDCGRIFQTVGRAGSSHYGIGYDGHISQYVSESDTAWTNSNWLSNLESVTIEVSDNDMSWYVNDETLNSLIVLVADIARRNNLGILVKGENVTWHSMFASTDCPGWYLLEKMDYIIAEANRINAGYTGYDYLYSAGSDTNGDVTYQAYTSYWLPAVSKSDNSFNGYAGIYNDVITGFRCKSNKSELIYEAHGLNRGWYGSVSSKDYFSQGGNSYAGIYGQPIDLIRIKAVNGSVTYRVKTREDGWLSWITKFSDSYDGYAGMVGHAIIGIQIK